jgi:hypothetical protein
LADAEAQRILQLALAVAETSAGANLYDRIRERFAPLGGVTLEVPPRQPIREPPHFD